MAITAVILPLIVRIKAERSLPDPSGVAEPSQADELITRRLKDERLVKKKADFAFESTLSGLRYAKRIQDWKSQGYSIEIAYLRLASPQLALSRVAARVKQGGHDVARSDVLRRYKRGWANFLEVYRPLADYWTIYDNSELTAKLQERSP